MELAGAARQARAWACYDCGKCTATCPITRAGSRYSPRRQVLATNSGRPESIVADPTLFHCLTCGACDRRCPAQVSYTGLVRDLRQMARGEGAEPDCPHGGALQSLMRMMAIGKMEQDRMAWVDAGLQTEPEKGEVFYWAGCAPYFDALFPEMQGAAVESARAAVGLLNSLGVAPVLSPEERCCGHDLLWNGDREGFELLARRNVELVAASGAKTLVTSCAECARTWKLDYEPFFPGKPPRVVHLSEFLAERLGELKLTGNGEIQVTFQDPCRLGRHMGIFEAPRRVLAALPGVKLVEMRRTGPSATCCAGGTWSHCDRFGKKIQVERLREARATGATVLVTACPKCRIHFRCAMKDPNLRQDIEIEMRDIAELVGGLLARKSETVQGKQSTRRGGRE